MNINFNRFLNMSINRENINELYILLYTILGDIIFEKTYYSKNIDLKFFTTNILGQDYRDYLFSARPMLYGRVIRDLRNSIDQDPDDFLTVAANIKKFISDSQYNKKVESQKAVTKPENSKKKKDPIDEWRKIINRK